MYIDRYSIDVRVLIRLQGVTSNILFIIEHFGKNRLEFDQIVTVNGSMLKPFWR